MVEDGGGISYHSRFVDLKIVNLVCSGARVRCGFSSTALAMSSVTNGVVGGPLGISSAIPWKSLLVATVFRRTPVLVPVSRTSSSLVPVPLLVTLEKLASFSFC